MIRLAARVAAALSLLAALVLEAPPVAGAAGPATAAITLLSQSAWVSTGHPYHLHLGLDGSAVKVQVAVYSRLTTRTAFDASLGGRMRGDPYLTAKLPIAKLPADPAGGVDIDVPINAPATEPGIPPLNARADGGGVYPVQVTTYDGNGALAGPPLTTYFVYASGDAAKLSVALVLGIHAPVVLGADHRPGQLAFGDAQRLGAIVASVAGAGPVPLTLDINPETVQALAGGTETDRATAAALAGLVDTPRNQLLAAPYVPVGIGALESAGLDSEVGAQLDAGRAALDASVHQAPSPTTWVSGEAMDPAALSALTSRGAVRLVVPAGTLTAPPASLGQSTFAHPTLLTAKGAGPVTVFGADSGLDAHFVSGGGQVLAANHLLAELSMIQLETPGDTRGVVVVPPAGWQPDPVFLATVLAGVQSNPLLAPVTVDGLFSGVATAQINHAPVTRSLTTSRAPLEDDASTSAWRNARQQLNGLNALVPANAALVASLSQQLLVSEATGLTAAERQLVLATVTGPIAQIERKISLPAGASITLTARQGNVPLTVLSDPSLAARVQLRLTSQKLIFQPFRGPGFDCGVPAPTTLVCQLTLTNANTTLKVPVETRASGVFSLVVSVLSPDGSTVLATTRNTVRSTAFSGVGVILIVAAGVFLALWWIRNARHGRRAHQLIEPPDFDHDPPGPPSSPPVLGGAVGSLPPPPAGGVARDPGVIDDAIDEFFATPGPEYPNPPEAAPDVELYEVPPTGPHRVSPSVSRRGPD